MTDKIINDFRQLAAIIETGERSRYFEASRMIMPLVVELDNIIGSGGLDAFFALTQNMYRLCNNDAARETAVALMSEALFKGRLKGKFHIEERHVDLFVSISLRQVLRALDFILEAADQSSSRKVVIWQNLRMGGMYPPMEKRMCAFIESLGYKVFELDPEKAKVDEENFMQARIILARFKVSSAPEAYDSAHPDDYIAYEQQKNKVWFLQAVAFKNGAQRLPVVMIDGSKKKFSLAQEYAAQPFIIPFNAIDFMEMDFCYQHLYWLSGYGFNNIGELLPASAPGRPDGIYYQMFAEKITDAVIREVELSQDGTRACKVG